MTEPNTMEPSAQEGIPSVNQTRRPATSAKVFLVLAAVIVVSVGVAAVVLTRYQAQRKAESSAKQSASQLTTAANAGAGPLKVTGNAAGSPPTTGGVGLSLAAQDPRAHPGNGSPGVPGVFVPAIDPGADPGAQDLRPIGVHATSTSAALAGAHPARPGMQAPQALDPLDAPVLLMPAPALGDAGHAPAGAAALPGPRAEGALDEALAQNREQLDQARARLDQLVKSMSAGNGAGQVPGAMAAGTPRGGLPAASASGEDGLKGSSTARVGAARLVAPAFTLPRGTTFPCALGSKIVSEQAGPVSCVVARNVYGHDGRVLLIERGSHLDGAYRVQSKVGQTRIAVIWERLRMPNGVVVDLSSPATGPLGEAGVDGFVDNHWRERIGAALLLSFIDDAVKIEVAREQAQGTPPARWCCRARAPRAPASRARSSIRPSTLPPRSSRTRARSSR